MLFWFPTEADLFVCFSEVFLAFGAVTFLGLALMSWLLRGTTPTMGDVPNPS
jgi:hypothetical protein